MEKISIQKIRTDSSPKMQSRHKYLFTDQIDQIIREVYLNQRDSKTGFGIRILAKKVGMPHWALKKRARELGLAWTKELPWSEAELGILERYAWMSDERIRLKLKAAGYCRTVTGIHLKLKRMRFKHDGSFYSAYSLAQALGIDPHAVTRDSLDPGSEGRHSELAVETLNTRCPGFLESESAVTARAAKSPSSPSCSRPTVWTLAGGTASSRG